jgi:serine/threonine protein kinase
MAQGSGSDEKEKDKKRHEIQKDIQIQSGSDGRRIGRWFIAETLGKGGYSWVKKGIDRKNGRIVALKFMERRLNSNGEWRKSQQTNIKNEIETLKCLRHVNIVRLLAYNLNAKYPDRSGKSRDVILLVLEYAAGGELFDYLYYTEKLEPILARTYFRQLVAGIECMHKCGIIHRDIKPQNLLLDNKYNLKITDFGLSKIDPTGNSNIKMNDWHVGTRGYQAPEILLKAKEYDKKIDIFAMGVVLFILLGGYPPFEHARDNDKWYQFIVHKKYKSFWKSHRNCGLRQEETDLITRMICYDPDKRISIDKIKKHSWFTNTHDILSNDDLIKVLRYRHQRMEQQRHSDPNKQNILQDSMKRPLIPKIVASIKEAGKTEQDLPPKLPENEIINPHDVYTSTKNTAYEVLQALGRAVTNNLNGNLIKPDYNNVEIEYAQYATETDKKEDMDAEEKDDDGWDGLYIDVVNFSLVFRAALQDLEDLTKSDVVYVHIGLYYDATSECNLVKFTCLSGDRQAFRKALQQLSTSAGAYLTGLDKKSTKIIMKKRENDQANDYIQQLYNKCFPDKK